MSIKLGEKITEWEHRKLAEVFRARRAHAEFNERVRPALLALRECAEDIDELYIGWMPRVTLKPGKKLRASVYAAVSDAFDQYPKMKVDHSTGNGYFEWRTGAPEMPFFRVALGNSACQVKRISTKELQEVEDVTYELVGDCSGLEE